MKRGLSAALAYAEEAHWRACIYLMDGSSARPLFVDMLGNLEEDEATYNFYFDSAQFKF